MFENNPLTVEANLRVRFFMGAFFGVYWQGRAQIAYNAKTNSHPSEAFLVRDGE